MSDVNLVREFCRLEPKWKPALSRFLRDLQTSGDEKHFHPHPFTPEEIERVVNYSGADLYYVLVENESVLGYGLLRGWDEGYAVPSLGLALHPAVRGLGLARLFMEFLHAAARRRGASEIRLKVYPDNVRAIKLYKSLGYAFEEEEKGQLVGIVKL